MLEENQNNEQMETTDIEQLPPYPNHPHYKDWAYRLTLFIIGFLGLDIVTLIIQLILQLLLPEYFREGSEYYITGLTMINTIRYCLLTMTFILLLYPRLKIIVKKFLDWKGDLIGLCFGAAIILMSIGYNLIISQFIDFGVNANEEAAESMITTFPILSIVTAVAAYYTDISKLPPT